jgi:hypothetical protein
VPTYEYDPRFQHDYLRLTRDQRRLFRTSLQRFIADLRTGALRPGLRVKRYQGRAGWFEMTWAPDGRALFEYGAEVRPGEVHVIWRRIGGHEIFDRP